MVRPHGRPGRASFQRWVSRWLRAPWSGDNESWDRFARFLSPDETRPVLLVHGPGGIGKTTLLEAFAEGATERGWSSTIWTGADLPTTPWTSASWVTWLPDRDRASCWSTAATSSPALARQLRSRVAQRLSAANRLVVAARESPEISWHRTGWDGRAQSLRVEALEAVDAEELLCRRGLADAEHRATVLAWSGGHPLALALAADLLRDRPDAASTLAVEPDVGGALVRHLLGGSANGHQQQVLAVLAHAGDVDEAMLAAAVPDADPRSAETWLRGLSLSTRTAHGCACTTASARCSPRRTPPRSRSARC